MTNQQPQAQPSGISGQVGDTARKALDVFAGSPAFLAVVLLNMAVFAFVYFSIEHARRFQHDQFDTLMQVCLAEKTAIGGR